MAASMRSIVADFSPRRDAVRASLRARWRCASDGQRFRIRPTSASVEGEIL
jgi:hypothetical protein